MNNENKKSKIGFNLISILFARCPACHKGAILHHIFGIHKNCAICNYNFHPEPGFYLGAMAVSYLLTAIFTIPPMIALKILDVDIQFLIAYPLIQFLFLGSFLMIYSRVLWLHLEYRMSNQLDADLKPDLKPKD